jgi:4-hydroxy-3-methylbut-2-enyl diphosphate reductase
MPDDPDNLAFLTQTTLSVDDTVQMVETLKRRFPLIVGPRGEDICYATSNRQAAVKDIAAECDAILVLGAPNSSNSVRLAEVAERAGKRARLIESARDLDLGWLEGVRTLGITAGASAPEILVRELVGRLAELFDVREREIVGPAELMTFKLPRALVAA